MDMYMNRSSKNDNYVGLIHDKEKNILFPSAWWKLRLMLLLRWRALLLC